MLICRTKLRKKLLQTQRFSKFSLGTLFLGVSSVFFQCFLCGQSVENSLFSVLTMCPFCAVIYASCYPLSEVRGATNKNLQRPRVRNPIQMTTDEEERKNLFWLSCQPAHDLACLVTALLEKQYPELPRFLILRIARKTIESARLDPTWPRTNAND